MALFATYQLLKVTQSFVIGHDTFIVQAMMKAGTLLQDPQTFMVCGAKVENF